MLLLSENKKQIEIYYGDIIPFLLKDDLCKNDRLSLGRRIMCDYFFFIFFLFFKEDLFMREGGGQRERERESQADHTEHGAQLKAQFHYLKMVT